MKPTVRQRYPGRLLLAVAMIDLALCAEVVAQPPVATAKTRDGRTLRGTIEGERSPGFRFRPTDGPAIPLEDIHELAFVGTDAPRNRGPAPFRVFLGLDQRISGGLVAIDEAAVRLGDDSGAAPRVIRRGGVLSIQQRPGEVLLLDDNFAAIDPKLWVASGALAGDRPTNPGGLRLPADGSALAYKPAEPAASGRLEMTFTLGPGPADDGARWWAELVFRGPAGGRAPVRAILGGPGQSPSVESPDGPTLAVQRLVLAPGRHLLTARFAADRLDLAIDGDSLAHGMGAAGPLEEFRLVTETADRPAAVGRTTTVERVRLTKSAEPEATPEIDPDQDDLRLTTGDQWFGRLTTADPRRISLEMDGQAVGLDWSEATAIHFRRDPEPGDWLDGLLVRVEWRAGPEKDPRDRDVAEGALEGWEADALLLSTPYAGTLRIPRDALRRLAVLGRARRLMIDTKPHHLGDQSMSNLDPPQPEGGVLERAFRLDADPPPGATVVLDVVGVAGEADHLAYVDFLRKKELRTNLLVNGTYVDYLNRHVRDDNESPARIRLAIPAGLLRAGANAVRLEQAGKADDPTFLDDLGILGIALELPASGRGGGGPP